MRKYFITYFLFISIIVDAQVNRIDHFFVSSPKAEKLFKLFKEELGLPVAWNYRKYGTYSTGAVDLGNVAFEFVSFDSLTITKFNAIAIEPLQSAKEFMLLLDKNQISHDSIEVNTFTKKNGSVGGWSIINLRDLLPEEAGLFIYDYYDRKEADLAIRSTAAELLKNKGGPLGVILLKEIVVKSVDLTKNKMKLATLPGVSNTMSNVFSFNSGPSIRLVSSKTSGIEKIVILVNSLRNTKNYLAAKKLLGNFSKNSIYMNSNEVEGLIIEFVEK